MTPSMIKKQFDRAAAAIRQAFRGKIERVKASDPIQRAQVSGLADETGQGFQIMQHFGFTSNPPADTDTVIIPLHGKTSHSVIIATENGAYRVKSLEPGEVSIYNQDGAKITLKKGKIIQADCDDYIINCKNHIINAESGTTVTTPKMDVSGLINGAGGMAISGGTGATFDGNINHTSGQITTTQIVKDGHVHTDSMFGTTSVPK